MHHIAFITSHDSHYIWVHNIASHNIYRIASHASHPPHHITSIASHRIASHPLHCITSIASHHITFITSLTQRWCPCRNSNRKRHAHRLSCTRAYPYACMHTYYILNTYKHTNIHKYIHGYIHKCIHAYELVNAYIHTCIHTAYWYSHTHK